MTIRNQRFSLLKQPISSTLNQHLVDYPTPSNLSYWWGFGSLAGTMILSVLSSLALVSGLMVVRAKNLVHSVLFFIPIFFSINQLFHYFCRLPIIKHLATKCQLLLFLISHFLLLLVLTKLVLDLGGYLFMDDLSRALSQFVPGFSGGLGGGSNTPPNPSGDFFLSSYQTSDPDYHDQRRGDSYFSSAPGVQETHRHASGSSTNLHLNLNDQSQDPIFLEVERLSLKCDKVKEKTILKTQSLLLERGYHIPDERDIERAINVVMTEHETIDIDRRRKRFYYLYSCLGKTGNKFWMELLETLADYNINIKSDSDN